MFPCIKMFEGLGGTIALSNSKQNVKVFFFSVDEKQTQDNLEQGKCSSYFIAFNIMYALEGSTDKPVQDDFSTLPITTNEYL